MGLRNDGHQATLDAQVIELIVDLHKALPGKKLEKERRQALQHGRRHGTRWCVDMRRLYRGGIMRIIG